MKRTSIEWVILLSLGAATAGRADTIRTTDGRVLVGRVKLIQTGLLVSPKRGTDALVRADKLLDWVTDQPASNIKSGVVLTDGTAVAGLVQTVTGELVRVAPPNKNTVAAPINSVARVVFQPVTDEQLAKAPSGSGGLLLTGGDFFEGQATRFDGRNLTMDSIVLGSTEFDTIDKAVALILKPSTRADGHFIVKMTDGSVLVGDTMDTEVDRLVLKSDLLGAVRISRGEVSRVSAGGDRITELPSLIPRVNAGMVIDGPAVGLAPSLIGGEPGHTIAGNGEITFDLGGKYDVFTSLVGATAGVVPVCGVRFSVWVDGKQRATTEPLFSTEDAIHLSVSVRGGQQLTLKTAGENGASTPGVWCRPILVKSMIGGTTKPAAGDQKHG